MDFPVSKGHSYKNWAWNRFQMCWEKKKTPKQYTKTFTVQERFEFELWVGKSVNVWRECVHKMFINKY